MRKITFLVASLALSLLTAYGQDSPTIDIPHDSVPEDHLAWFSLRGQVAEVVEYDYRDYTKTIWRFDQQGRLTEYREYTHPFAGSGGCVFTDWAHYRYAYDETGKIQFLETYNADYSTVDDYADMILELFPPQIKDANLMDQAEKEFGDSTYCFSHMVSTSDSVHFDGIRYDRYGNWIEQAHSHGTDDPKANASVRVREIKYYEPFVTSVPVADLKVLPADVTEDKAFYLCFDYMGYAFEGNLYPLHNGWWIVLSHWCLDEEETIYIEEEEGSEPVPAASKYKDPFAGMTYPIIKTDSIGFMTRNYGGQTIKLYSTACGKKVWDKLKVESHLEVLDADVETSRLLCRTNPSHWSWEGQQFYSVYGWMDEEWVCANLLTTCP